MKPILCLLLLAAPALSANDPAIDKLVDALAQARNQADVRLLFAFDADPAEILRFVSQHTRMLAAADRPWSEIAPPRLVIRSVRMVAPDVALVDVTDQQIGSLAARAVPMLLVIRRSGDGWKIASLRFVSNVAQGDGLRQPL